MVRGELRSGGVGVDKKKGGGEVTGKVSKVGVRSYKESARIYG